jgi:Zn-dependent protease
MSEREQREWWGSSLDDQRNGDDELSGFPQPSPPSPVREHRPLRDLVGRLWAVIAAIVGVAIKFGFAVFKFFSIFIAVAGYALIWGWKFGVGFVLLILVHELGHYLEARRQGLHPNLPVFIPFVGAYVAIKDARLDPYHNALVALAGPIAGGLGSAACWAVGVSQDSDLLQALAFTGFLLNLINLIPLGILDGGMIWRSIRLLRWAHDRRAGVIIFAFAATALALAYGMYVAHVPQTRL